MVSVSKVSTVDTVGTVSQSDKFLDALASLAFKLSVSK